MQSLRVPASMSTAATSPSEFLQLAGHPLRWRLLAALSGSDRTVQELTSTVGEAQNLVSYHLRKLRDGELVSARQSSFDGRDAYYTLDLARFQDLLFETAATLHPGIGLTAPSPRTPDATRPPVRVLFLCTGNSARSQIAEAIVRQRSGGEVEVHSAGSHPKPMHANAVRVLRDELGVDPTPHEPKHVDLFAGQRFDWVISLCDKVREVCPEFPGQPQTVHWSLADPSAVPGARESWAAFRALTVELETRVTFLLAQVAHPSN